MCATYKSLVSFEEVYDKICCITFHFFLSVAGSDFYIHLHECLYECVSICLFVCLIVWPVGCWSAHFEHNQQPFINGFMKGFIKGFIKGLIKGLCVCLAK